MFVWFAFVCLCCSLAHLTHFLCEPYFFLISLIRLKSGSLSSGRRTSFSCFPSSLKESLNRSLAKLDAKRISEIFLISVSVENFALFISRKISFSILSYIFLKGICSLWGIEHDDIWLYETGEKLGSDVNLFFTPGFNLLTGTGAKSKKIDISINGAVLIFHNKDKIKNKTKLAYDLLTSDVFTDGKYCDQLIKQINNRSLLLESIECYNVFENYMNKLYPGILEIKENLEQQTGYDLHLSGSGPSLFCLINDKEKAMKIYNTVDSRIFGKLLTFPLESK